MIWRIFSSPLCKSWLNCAGARRPGEPRSIQTRKGKTFFFLFFLINGGKWYAYTFLPKLNPNITLNEISGYKKLLPASLCTSFRERHSGARGKNLQTVSQTVCKSCTFYVARLISQLSGKKSTINPERYPLRVRQQVCCVKDQDVRWSRDLRAICRILGKRRTFMCAARRLKRNKND